MLEQRLRRAEERVRGYLARYGGDLPSVRIAVEPGLGEGTLATHRHPGTVVVRDASVPESVIAHELAHIAQRTLEQFRGFRLLYTVTVRCKFRRRSPPDPHSPGESPRRGGGPPLSVASTQPRPAGGESEEGRRPAPLGRARGEGRAVACPDASARAFPAN